MLAPLRRRQARKHCFGVRIGLTNGTGPRAKSTRENKAAGPGPPGNGPRPPAPPKPWAIAADPVAQMQSSRMVAATGADAFLGIENLRGLFTYLVAGTR
jgi:hypothetical protein